jgi:integrase
MTTDDGAWGAELEAWAGAMRRARLSPETIKLRLYDVDRLRRWAAPRGPWELTEDDLADYMADHRWARETARGARSSLRGFYRWAHGVGRIAEDPAAGLARIAPETPHSRPAAPGGVVVALRMSEERVVLMLRLANDVGMRRAEVAQVHTRDVVEDLDGWSLTVHGKGSKERLVPLPDDLARTLRHLPPGFAFPGRCDGHLSARWVGKLVARALPGPDTMHALRHLAATELYRRTGHDLRLVQELLGHASPATTARYIGVSKEDMRRAVTERARAWAG